MEKHATLLLVFTMAFYAAQGTSVFGRPFYRECSCLNAWPYSGNATIFDRQAFGGALKINAALANYAWNMPAADAASSSCVQFGPYFGSPAWQYQMCAPDTSQGPCMGLSIYDQVTKSYGMMCGQQGTSDATANKTAPNRAMTAREKDAAMAFAYAITVAVPKPACTCDTDWTQSQLAAKYCGGNSDLARGPVNQTMCSNSPKVFNNLLNGTVRYGYENGVTQWCKVSGDCYMANGRVDECTGETWMQYPNPPAATLTELNYANNVNIAAQNLAREVNGGTVNGNTVTGGFVQGGANEYYPVVFFPENAAALHGVAEPKTLAAQNAQITALASYPAQSVEAWQARAATYNCNATCLAAKAAAAAAAVAVNANVTAQQIADCNANPICQPKQEAYSCSGIDNTTNALCNADAACLAKVLARTPLAGNPAQSQASTTAAGVAAAFAAMVVAAVQ